MTLEAMVVQQEHLYYGLNKDLPCWVNNYELNVEAGRQGGLTREICYYGTEIDGSWAQMTQAEYNQQPLVINTDDAHSLRAEVLEAVSGVSGDGGGRKRKRRKRRGKERDEEIVEKQRMTHIAVERNRRKQMNHYLAVLRSLMPPPYSQRGDQASIVGGAINFVKELEQLLQYLQAQYQHGHLNKKKRRMENHPSRATPPPLSADPIINIDTQNQCHENEDWGSVFSDFFHLPQYLTASAGACYPNDTFGKRSGAADVEVRAVESHANLKVRCRRQPKQLLKLLAGLLALRLTILHLHVTTFDQTVLYSFNVKVEDSCQLSSVDEIATAVHDLMAGIRNQAVFD